MLEWLAGLEATLDEAPNTIPFMKIEIPDDLAKREVTDHSLPGDWRRHRTRTQSIGDHWLQSAAFAILIVPSVLLPARNVLINPNHRDAARIVVLDKPDFPFDPRLAR